MDLQVDCYCGCADLCIYVDQTIKPQVAINSLSILLSDYLSIILMEANTYTDSSIPWDQTAS